MYKGLIRALEPYHDDRKSSSALCLLSRTNLYKVATLVGTSNLPILASAKRPCTSYVIITVYLTIVISQPSLWLSDLRLCVRSEQDDPTPKHSANEKPHLLAAMMLSSCTSSTPSGRGEIPCVMKPGPETSIFKPPRSPSIVLID